MKIITNTNILLDNNIIAIYTNLESFIERLQVCEEDGLLRIAQKDKTELNNMLYVFNKPDNVSTFLGLFYTVDPFEVDVDIVWTILHTADDFAMFLEALSSDSLFSMAEKLNHLFEGEQYNIQTIGSGYDYAEDLQDEYDEDGLELDVLDDYLDNLPDE